ncbi:hypothetical protein PMAYCL1PPCAC_27995, partial [Pristionchus mayeri]
MSEALEIFDICQTLIISMALIITIPPACFVYFKLLFVPPITSNYTFKLIVFNGVAELTYCVVYLFAFQFASYPFMTGFYELLMDRGLVIMISTIHSYLKVLTLSTAFFVALNRAKSIKFLRKSSNDSRFFFVSVVVSLVLPIPITCDVCIFSQLEYEEFEFGGSVVYLPHEVTNGDILRKASDALSIILSIITLIVNIFLSVILARERKYIDKADMNKFNGEKGLIITSIVSYAFYMLCFASNILARYFDVLFCGFVQWLFLGLNSITPFWCIILFTPTVRRLAFSKQREGKPIVVLSQ